MKLTFVVDSIDNNWARIESEDATRIQIPAAWIPENAKESSVLQIDIGGQGDHRTVRVTLDRQATEARSSVARDLRGSIPKGTTGDIDL